jgi:hypothetical protein
MGRGAGGRDFDDYSQCDPQRDLSPLGKGHSTVGLTGALSRNFSAQVLCRTGHIACRACRVACCGAWPKEPKLGQSKLHPFFDIFTHQTALTLLSKQPKHLERGS